MPSVIDRFWRWARQACLSLSGLLRADTAAGPADCPEDHLIYRLKRWPKLPSAGMTTDIYRTLSVMSTRPVNRRWILNNSNIRTQEVDLLLRRLVEQDAVEVTDAAKYGPSTTAV
jgi:hypothetical protein